MWSSGLGALRGQGPEAALEINLIPPHGPPLLAPAARVRNAIEGLPEAPQFISQKDAFPGPFHPTTLRARSRVCFDKLALDGVPEQANERFSNPVGHVAQTMLMLELVQQFDDVSSSDLANKPSTERRKDVIAKAAADALVAFKMPLDVGEIVVSDLGYGPRPGLGFLPILGLALFFGKQVNSLFRGIGDVAGALAGIGKAQSRVGAKYGRSLFLVPWAVTKKPVSQAVWIFGARRIDTKAQTGQSSVRNDKPATCRRLAGANEPVSELGLHVRKVLCLPTSFPRQVLTRYSKAVGKRTNVSE